MTIEVLVCRLDGTQTTQTRQVPDDWFDAPDRESDTDRSAEHQSDTPT